MSTNNVVFTREVKLNLLHAGSSAPIFYSACATRLELPTKGLNRGREHALGHALAEVTAQCIERGLPIFPLMVVRKDTGMPGRGVDAALVAAGIATKAELDDPKMRVQVMASLQEQVRQYCKLAANDETLVARFLRA